LGIEAYDDLVQANARIAELEAALLRARVTAVEYQSKYWAWREKNGRTFTLAEELVIALGLQHTPKEEAAGLALARINAMRDACSALKVDHVELIPLHKPDHWYLPDTGDSMDDCEHLDDCSDDVVEGWAVENESINHVIDLRPIFIGESRFAVVYYDGAKDAVEGEIKISWFTDEQEAKRFAVECAKLDAEEQEA
jgi:hypothetical protein